MWLRTKDGWYIHEIRGAVFVTWVSEQDKAHACTFPKNDISDSDWICLMEKCTGKQLTAINPHT